MRKSEITCLSALDSHEIAGNMQSRRPAQTRVKEWCYPDKTKTISALFGKHTISSDDPMVAELYRRIETTQALTSPNTAKLVGCKCISSRSMPGKVTTPVPLRGNILLFSRVFRKLPLRGT